MSNSTMKEDVETVVLGNMIEQLLQQQLISEQEKQKMYELLLQGKKFDGG